MMFETVELGQTLSKSDYKRRLKVLRPALLEAQRQIKNARVPVIVTFAGPDGAGKSECVNLLKEWLDPRGIVTQAFDWETDEERARPRYWRYWRALPKAGQVGLFLSAWYSKPLTDRAYGGAEAALDEQLDEIVDFERTLTDGGALIVKFWMHLNWENQQRRLQELSADPRQSWRVRDKDLMNLERYDGFMHAAETIIRQTSAPPSAEWHLVEGTDSLHRGMRVGEILLERIRFHLYERKKRNVSWTQEMSAIARPPKKAKKGDKNGHKTPAEPRRAVLFDTLDMTRALGKKEYNERLDAAQNRLGAAQLLARQHGISTVLVFEGPDAAGKGGAIRRTIAPIDARHISVISVAKPTDEENAHHYLWRFWRHIPAAGRVTVFDRSWYGRVLVERVERFANPDEWRRAYAEINRFERTLVEANSILLKFWIHISDDEQLARFEAREKTPHKKYKLTDEDWRNREKWHDYELAAHDMIARTSHRRAPWVVVEGNDKRYARVKVCETVCNALERALEARGVTLD